MVVCCQYLNPPERRRVSVELEQAQQLAHTLLAEHNLTRWSFRFDHARQRCGSCNYSQREITLSRHFTRMNDATEVRATLLHEIAHALVGPGHGHNHTWRQTAQRIGAPVQATNLEAAMPTPRWSLMCEDCGRCVAQRHRRALKLDYTRCGYCGPKAGKLYWQASNAADRSVPLS